MSERPIPFSGESVRAILDGRKSQTRRTRGLEAINEQPEIWTFLEQIEDEYHFGHGDPNGDAWGEGFVKCPYGVVGNKLWGKEKHSVGGNGVFFPDSCDGSVHIAWTSPRFMKKEYARIWLEITNVRVERVQDIDAVEAEAEGMRRPKRLCPDRHDEYILDRFIRYWNSLNAKRGFGWDKNPWVWVIEFKVISRNALKKVKK